MSEELWISAAALVMSGGSAAVAGLAYRQADRWRREVQFAQVVAYRALLRRKSVLKALETEWDVGGVHGSVRELREDLVNGIGKLPEAVVPTAEAAVEACALLLAELRPWAFDREKVDTLIDAFPEVLDLIEKWLAAMRGCIAELDAYTEHRGLRRRVTRTR